ncbi:MAG: hypothetical protein AB4041_04250 [Microcystaceae cyanobacterium]
MKPTFKTPLAWDQANLLMQPILLRVIDNLRKELEASDWQGTYQEVKNPIPGYHLNLTQNNQSVTVDIWQLCFKICFLDYTPSLFIDTSFPDEIKAEEVEVDTRLIDESGEIDWQNLETKTKRQITFLFASLPQS